MQLTFRFHKIWGIYHHIKKDGAPCSYLGGCLAGSLAG